MGWVRKSSTSEEDTDSCSQWPSEDYLHDIVGFARNVLGVEPWERQIDILQAVQENDRVCVASGHKVSKSQTCAIVALWYYTLYPDSRVLLTCTTARQVNEVVWREVRWLFNRSKSKLLPSDPALLRNPDLRTTAIDGTMSVLASSGLKSEFRQILGFTCGESEGAAGLSGAHCMWIVDEASGVQDRVFEAIEGNRAGGAKILLVGNPTRNDGEFFRAFYTKRAFYHCIQLSSEESPNVVAGRTIIPGLCEREWIDTKKREWGENSPQYKVRAKGEFALCTSDKAISLPDVIEAEKRYGRDPTLGTRVVALVPGGPGRGTESVAVFRIGPDVYDIRSFCGKPDEHVAHVCVYEPDVIVVDTECPNGKLAYKHLKEWASQSGRKCIQVRPLQRATRDPLVYDRVRDEMWACLAEWMKEGSIPPDGALSGELCLPEWYQAGTGALCLTSRDKMREELQRHPDRSEALAMCVWHRDRIASAAQSPRVDGCDPYKEMR